MPKSDKDDQIQVEQVFGFHPYLWQICIIHAIFNGKDVIKIGLCVAEMETGILLDQPQELSFVCLYPCSKGPFLSL
jgi:hypothetical protein